MAPCTVAHHDPLSMEFSRLEYWSGLPFPSPGDVPNPGIKPRSPALQADSSLSESPRKLRKSEETFKPLRDRFRQELAFRMLITELVREMNYDKEISVIGRLY